MFVLINILISGRCDSLGGGGLGGGLDGRLGVGLSGKRISIFGESAGSEDVLGIAMPACMHGSGSRTIGEFPANES